MEHSKTSAFGKNNFAKLEAAGLICGEDPTAGIKAKMQKRIEELATLDAKLVKVEAALKDLYVLEKPQRLKKLSSVLAAVKKLHGEALPTGSKKHIAHCVNELTSLREGVYSSNTKMDKKALTLISASLARTEIKALVVATEHRLDAIRADSSQTSDMDDFYKKAEDVINRHSGAAERLSAIDDKPFLIARVPVVPADNTASPEKLVRYGFDVDGLGGYSVFKNQLVIGIRPQSLLGEHSGAVKGEKAIQIIRDEAERLRKLLQKKMNQRLQFVSDKACTHGKGTWFWLMTDRDLDALARATPGSHVKIQRWGFAFGSK